MARTYRRKHDSYEYRWVLREWDYGKLLGCWTPVDPHSKPGRKALACFHSDNQTTMNGAAPRWYRKASDHRIRTLNNRMLHRWLTDPDFEPVFRDWHRHDANWSWW